MADFDLSKLFEAKNKDRTPKGAEKVLGRNLSNVATQMAPGYEDSPNLQLNKEQMGNTFLGKDLGAGVAGAGNFLLNQMQNRKDPVETSADVRGMSTGGNIYAGMAANRRADKMEAAEERGAARKEGREDSYRKDMYGMINSAMNRRQQLALAKAKGGTSDGDKLYKIEELAMKNKGYQDMTRRLAAAKDPVERTAIQKQMNDVKNQMGSAYFDYTPFGQDEASDVGFGGQTMTREETAALPDTAKVNYEKSGFQRFFMPKDKERIKSVQLPGGATVNGKRISGNELAKLPPAAQRKVAVAALMKNGMSYKQALARIDGSNTATAGL